MSVTRNTPEIEAESLRWLSQWKAGDERAGARLIKRYTPVVHACAKRYFLPDDSRYDDLVSDGLERMYRSLQSYDASRKSKLLTWLIKQIRFRYTHSLRHLPNDAQFLVVEGEELERADTTDLIARQLGRMELQKALNRLSPRERACFLLRYQQGYTNAEIAKMAHLHGGKCVSESRTSLIISEAKHKLAALLAEREEHGRSRQ